MRQDRRLSALRLPAGVVTWFRRSSEPAPHFCTDRDPAGTTDGAVKEPCVRPLMETGVETQQAAAVQGGIFSRASGTNQEVHPCIRPLLERFSRETIEALSEDRLCPGQSLQRDPMLAERIKRLQNDSWSPGRYNWHLHGPGNRRCVRVSGPSSRHQLLRPCGEEKSSAEQVMRTLFQNNATSISASAGELPSWRLDSATNWRWHRREKCRKETATVHPCR